LVEREKGEGVFQGEQVVQVFNMIQIRALDQLDCFYVVQT
jgi:hypothetical protein